MVKERKRWLAFALALALFAGSGFTDSSVAMAQDSKEAVEEETMGSGIEAKAVDEDQVSLPAIDGLDTDGADKEATISLQDISDAESEAEEETEESGANWNLTERVKMVDLSYWDGKVNFAKLKKAGISYVMLRIGHGLKKDTKFTTYYKAAKQYGFKIGVYYYSTATTVDKASKEADDTLALLEKNNISPADLELPVCFDFEDSKALKTSKENCTNMTITYLEKIKAAGYEPMIYSSASFYSDHLYYEQIQDYKIWVANWKATGPIMIYPYDAWQYSATSRLSGVPSKCDVSYLYPNYIPVTGLTADADTVTIKKGKKKTLSVTLEPSDCTNKRLIFRSSNKKIVKVYDSQKGIIKGMKKGTAEVTVETPNGQSYIFTVVVK